MTNTMTYTKTFKLDMEVHDLRQIANGIARLSRGLSIQVFDLTDDNYAREPGDLPGGSKADEWTLSHYETAGGAIDLIAASSEILSRALLDVDFKAEG